MLDVSFVLERSAEIVDLEYAHPAFQNELEGGAVPGWPSCVLGPEAKVVVSGEYGTGPRI